MKNTLKIAVLILALGFSISATYAQYNYRIKMLEQQEANRIETEIRRKELEREQKINAIWNYMSIAAICQGYDPNDIQLSPEVIVNECIDANFDLVFLLAQAHQESCFGLTPRARRTNSVFSVGLHDNGKDYSTYETQNESVKAYINLIKTDYLNDGEKEISNLLKPDSFVNIRGERYASDPLYEMKISSIMTRISNSSDYLNI